MVGKFIPVYAVSAVVLVFGCNGNSSGADQSNADIADRYDKCLDGLGRQEAELDTDGDGFVDACDNCPQDSNKDQSDQPREIILSGDMNGAADDGDAPHAGIVSGGDLTYVPKRNEEITAIGGARIDCFYATDETMNRLTDPTSFVIRNTEYGETESQFRETCSDHFPVLIDYYIGPLTQ